MLIRALTPGKAARGIAGTAFGAGAYTSYQKHQPKNHSSLLSQTGEQFCSGGTSLAKATGAGIGSVVTSVATTLAHIYDPKFVPLDKASLLRKISFASSYIPSATLAIYASYKAGEATTNLIFSAVSLSTLITEESKKLSPELIKDLAPEFIKENITVQQCVQKLGDIKDRISK